MASRRQKKKDRHRRDEQHRFTVRGIRRDPVDIGKLSKALLGLAVAEAERQAQSEHTAQHAVPEATSQDNTPSRRGD